MMKQVLVYSLKVWFTSSLLAIAVTSFYYYQLSYKSLNVFGAAGWIPSIIADYWEHLEPGFVILWFIMAMTIQIVNRTASPFLRKKLIVFLVAEGLTTVWLILSELFEVSRHFLPGVFSWLICSFSLAFSIIIYKLDDRTALDNQGERSAHNI